MDSAMHVKISDFGLANTKQSMTATNTPSNVLGSVPWAAPEYLTIKRKSERNEKGDVFSFGVILWELVTRDTPWKTENISLDDIKELVLDGERLKIPENCIEELRKVMEQCWKQSTSLLL
jgi:serine/threonine protein kinase